MRKDDMIAHCETFLRGPQKLATKTAAEWGKLRTHIVDQQDTLRTAELEAKRPPKPLLKTSQQAAAKPKVKPKPQPQPQAQPKPKPKPKPKQRCVLHACLGTRSAQGIKWGLAAHSSEECDVPHQPPYGDIGYNTSGFVCRACMYVCMCVFLAPVCMCLPKSSPTNPFSAVPKPVVSVPLIWRFAGFARADVAGNVGTIPGRISPMFALCIVSMVARRWFLGSFFTVVLLAHVWKCSRMQSLMQFVGQATLGVMGQPHTCSHHGACWNGMTATKAGQTVLEIVCAGNGPPSLRTGFGCVPSSRRTSRRSMHVEGMAHLL